MLFRRNGFTRERRFLAFERSRFKQTGIRRDGVARFKHYDITDDEPVAFDNAYRAVAQDFAFRFCHFFKSIDRLFRLAFLHYAEKGVEQNDKKYNENIGDGFPRDRGGDKADKRRGKQDDYHRVGELHQKPLPKRGLFGFGKAVWTVLCEP